jgi:hypothetical protein
MLTEMLENQRKSITTEKDRVSYKEGLVDGVCITSWQGSDKDDGGNLIDFVGKGDGKKLSDYLDEIGSVYGFDGKEELKRVKTAEMDDTCDINANNGNKVGLKEVTDEDVEAVDDDNLNNFEGDINHEDKKHE